MTLEGIDCSHWQSGLRFSGTGIDFAIMKATDGTNYVDATCDGFVQQAKNLGIKWGVYHFVQNVGSLNAEADWFVKNVQGYVGHGILVLDWEHGNLGNVSGAKQWLDRVYSKTGVRPLLYTSQSVAASHDWSSVAKDYGLWVARYASSIGDTGAFKSVAMWQYTSTGHVSGYSGNIDKDHFYGDKAAWDAYAKKASTPDPKPDPDDGDDDMALNHFDKKTEKDLLGITPNEWTTVPVDDDGSVAVAHGPKQIVSAVVNVTVSHLDDGDYVFVRCYSADHKTGEPISKDVRHRTGATNRIPATDGNARESIPIVWDLQGPDKGFDSRQLRVEVKPVTKRTDVNVAQAWAEGWYRHRD